MRAIRGEDWVISMWGRALLDEIEKTIVSEGEVKIWSLGGAGFVIKTKKAIVYIDPYFGGSPSKDWLRMIAIPINPNDIRKATAVLSTHEHTDHCHRDTILPILHNTEAIFIGPSKSAELVKKWGFKDERRIHEVKPGDIIKVEDLTIKVYESRDLYSETPVTYVLNTYAGGIFHSGDTSYFTGLKEIGDNNNIRVALLNLGRNPRGRDDYMTPCDVVRAAIDLKAEIVVPMHYDIWKYTWEDPKLVEIIARHWNVNLKVIIMRLGDCLTITAR